MGVHPDNTFFTTVYTPHKYFPTPAGNLCCPTHWKEYTPMSDASMEQNWCKWPEHDWKRFVDVSNKLIAAERIELERLKKWLTLLDAARELLVQVEMSSPEAWRASVESERTKLRAAIDKLQATPPGGDTK